MSIQSEFTLYRDAANGLIGTVDGANWAWPGQALTASTFVLRADLGMGRVKHARWVLVWNPRTSNPASPTGVRLVSADLGPANIAEVARIVSPSDAAYNSPKVDAVEVTAALNAIIGAGQLKTIGQQTFGNGGNGCLIYASWLEVVWE
jgi:hypothetical protein